MLELLALAGVAGVCTLANSLLEMEPATSGAIPEDLTDAHSVSKPFDYTIYPNADEATDDSAAPYKDLLATIFDDETPAGGLTREPVLADTDPLDTDNWKDAAETPVISDYSYEDQLIIAYPHTYGGDMSIDVQDRDGDAHISVGGAPVAVLQGAAGSVTAEDIVLVPDSSLA